MLWPALANGLPEVGPVPWGSSLFCVGGENDVSSAITEKALFNSPRLVKREAGFPNPRRALIGSNQLWRANDSPYYRELFLKIPGVRRHQVVSAMLIW